jgi:hypothetical protein
MEDLSVLVARVESLERRSRWTAVLAILTVAAACAVTTREPGGVLRTRGIVVTDAADRPRLVFGAPMAEVLDDPRFAETVGAVVLDADGRLNVALGWDPPLVYGDGSVGKRIGHSTGFVIYDPRTGGERGGLGAFADGTANICLDYEKDKEAVCMTVAAEDAWTAVMLNGTPEEEQFDRVGMFLSGDGTGVVKAFGGRDHRDGVVLESGTGPARVVHYEADGGPVGEALWKPVGSGS